MLTLKRVKKIRYEGMGRITLLQDTVQWNALRIPFRFHKGW
jgi:hypothetical protein